jgi:hypothetical protein
VYPAGAADSAAAKRLLTLGINSSLNNVGSALKGFKPGLPNANQLSRVQEGGPPSLRDDTSRGKMIASAFWGRER